MPEQGSVYIAQGEACQDCPPSEDARRLLNGLPSIEHYETYLRGVMTEPWFRKEFPKSSPDGLTVVKLPTSESYYQESTDTIGIGGYVLVNTATIREWYCLHELAHRETRGHDHDHVWRNIYLFLVREQIGREAEARLRSAFDRHGLPTGAQDSPN
jgi:putative metallohydrolase (TIGR04338 family)